MKQHLRHEAFFTEMLRYCTENPLTELDALYADIKDGTINTYGMAKHAAMSVARKAYQRWQSQVGDYKSKTQSINEEEEEMINTSPLGTSIDEYEDKDEYPYMGYTQ